MQGFEALFTTPTLQLRSFKLQVGLTGEVSSDAVFEVFIEKTGSLEIFTYKGNFPTLEVLRRFVEANPRLRNVTFEAPPIVDEYMR